MGGFWDVTDWNQVCSLWASGGMLYWQEYWVKESLFPAGSSQWERAGFFTCTGGWELWTPSSEIHSAGIPNLGTAAENIQFNTYWLGPLLMCWFVNLDLKSTRTQSCLFLRCISYWQLPSSLFMYLVCPRLLRFPLKTIHIHCTAHTCNY